MKGDYIIMLWYMIEGFNGYEINEQGRVRSMKMMWKDPGHLLKLSDEGYYTLSNNENKRVRRTPKQLIDLVFNSGIPLKPRSEDSVYMGGRNKHFYFDEGVNPKIENEYRMDFSKFIVKE